MDAFLTVTLMTLIAGVGGTGLGGILGALVRTESNRIVSLLLSATSGVMISIVCFELMVESLEAAEEEVERLRALVAKQAATLEEKIRALASKEVGYDDQARTLANKDAEISSRDAIIADRDRQITDLRSQLSEAQARVQLSNANSMSLSPVTFDASTFTEESPVGAISMLNMLNGVMAAFKQQVKDARILGEQEGRKAQQHEFEDVINKARNDGYRDAMTYLDDRATTARESGAREERARIANMGFFERRRYLNIHVA